MLYRRSFARELASVSAGVFVILLCIALVGQLVRFLSMAANGKLASEALWAMIGFAALRYAPVLIALTVFISILTVLTRFYRDHEMEVWLCAGISIRDWVRPVLIYSIPLALLAAGMSLAIVPWAEGVSSLYREQIKTREDTSLIAAGLFKEFRNADRIYFVEYFSPTTGNAKNIFVQDNPNHKTRVVRSEEGRQIMDAQGDRWLVLLRGKAYEWLGPDQGYRAMSFAQSSLHIASAEAQVKDTSVRSAASLQLLHSQDHGQQAELAWRLSWPITTVILSLLAIPLSAYNPRAGRLTNLIFAVLIYFIYNNFLGVAEAWVAQGRLPSWIGLWPVHVAFGGLAWQWLKHRQKYPGARG